MHTGSFTAPIHTIVAIAYVMALASSPEHFNKTFSSMLN